jgi:hypothetical protein
MQNDITSLSHFIDTYSKWTYPSFSQKKTYFFNKFVSTYFY